MKFVSLDMIELYYSKCSAKAIQFIDHKRTYSGENTEIWIPRKLIKIGVNNADDFIFFIPSWYYMKEIQPKLNYRNYTPKHFEDKQIDASFNHVISGLDAEFD